MTDKADTGGRDGLGEQFEAIRPGRDIGRKQMRASLREKLFGAPSDPVKLGRFLIVERLGQGGMGVVYRAYDPDLDRRVAIKLLRRGIGSGGQQATDRLKREAQALARLSHPNVVAVHEVGVHVEGGEAGQVFIVMEFVVGMSLREWVDSEPRSWREILDAYLQAGAGLQAAHRVGLVHRDFKPDNALLGEDGRVRVLDFGLARARLSDEDADADADADGDADEHPALLDGLDGLDGIDPEASTIHGNEPALPGPDDTPEIRAQKLDALRHAQTARLSSDLRPQQSSGKQLLDVPLTATGAILGTPAFMSPEQFQRRRAGPASDQFSFCLSLYESLYGHRAFAGETLAELRGNVCAGAVRPPSDHGKVPRRLFPILRRGLSRDPDDRYPSMEELLAALAYDPVRRRRLGLLGLLIAVLLGTTVYSLVRTPGAGRVDTCRGAAAVLAGVWNQERAEQVTRALLATGQRYAEPASQRVREGLDEYAEAWVAMHTSACRAHQRGEQSGGLLDKRMTCLVRRRAAMGSAVAVLLESDAASLERAVDVVRSLPAVADCGNLEVLVAAVAPPEDAQVAAEVEALRVRLSRVTALEHAGRYATAREGLRAVMTEAELLGYEPLRAELSLVAGRLEIALGDPEDAIERLRQSVAMGLGNGADRIALEAWARYIYAKGTSADAAGALESLFAAEALAARLPDTTAIRALLRNNAGVVALAGNDRAQARASFEQALTFKRAVAGPLSVELVAIPFNLALVTDDPTRRQQLMTDAGDELLRTLGALHPRTLEMRLVQGYYSADIAAARELLAEVCSGYLTYHPAQRVKIADCHSYSGFIAAELGDRADATRRFAVAAQNQPKKWLAGLARGYAELYSDRPAQAVKELAAALPGLHADAAQWWNKKPLAAAYLAQGLSYQALGRHASARTALKLAHELFVEVAGHNDIVSTQLRLARTRMALADALWPADATAIDAARRARAHELQAQAAAWYRGTGSARGRFATELQRWREARGLPAAPAR